MEGGIEKIIGRYLRGLTIIKDNVFIRKQRWHRKTLNQSSCEVVQKVENEVAL